MTTGKLVFGFGGPNGLTPCVYRDLGPYEGTIPEYRVRKVSQVEIFGGLDAARVKRVLCGDDAKPCGCRWGGGMSRLYPIANEGAIETLQRENAEAKAVADKRRAEADELERQREEALKKSGLCPKCGTWCYGDCEAGKGRSN